MSAKLFNFRPAAFAAVFLCLGVFSAVVLLFFELPAYLLTLLLPIIIFFRKEKCKQTAIAVLLLLSAFWIGFGFAFSKINGFQTAKVYQSGEYYVIGTIASAMASTLYITTVGGRIYTGSQASVPTY